MTGRWTLRFRLPLSAQNSHTAAGASLFGPRPFRRCQRGCCRECPAYFAGCAITNSHPVSQSGGVGSRSTRGPTFATPNSPSEVPMPRRPSAGSSTTRSRSVLRQAQQRHTTLFAAEMIEGLTPTQWAALVKLQEYGTCTCSQNHLGRLTAMDHKYGPLAPVSCGARRAGAVPPMCTRVRCASGSRC